MKQYDKSLSEGVRSVPSIEGELSFSGYNLLDATTSRLTKEDMEAMLRRPLSKREVFLIKQVGFVVCLLFSPGVNPSILDQLVVDDVQKQVQRLFSDEVVGLALTESEAATLRLISATLPRK